MTGLKSLGKQGDKSTASVTKIGKAAQRAGASIQSGLGRMGVQSLARLKFAAVAAGAAFTAIGVASARAGIMIASQRDAQLKGLGALLQSQRKAEEHFVRLQSLARLPGIGLGQALEMSNLLLATGASAATAERTIAAFGNALALAGKSADELPGIALALSQIAQTPKVMQQDLYQLINRIPVFGKVLMSEFGSTRAEEINRAVGSTKEFMERLISSMERMPRAAETTANALFNVGMTVDNIKAEFGAGVIAGDHLRDALTGLDTALGKLLPKAKALGEAFGERAVRAIDSLTDALGGAAEKTDKAAWSTTLGQKALDSAEAGMMRHARMLAYLARGQDRLGEKTASAAREYYNLFLALRSQGAPIEEFTSRFSDAEQMLQSGQISVGHYNKALRRLTDDMRELATATEDVTDATNDHTDAVNKQATMFDRLSGIVGRANETLLALAAVETEHAARMRELADATGDYSLVASRAIANERAFARALKASGEAAAASANARAHGRGVAARPRRGRRAPDLTTLRGRQASMMGGGMGAFRAEIVGQQAAAIFGGSSATQADVDRLRAAAAVATGPAKASLEEQAEALERQIAAASVGTGGGGGGGATPRARRAAAVATVGSEEQIRAAYEAEERTQERLVAQAKERVAAAKEAYAVLKASQHATIADRARAEMDVQRAEAALDAQEALRKSVMETAKARREERLATRKALDKYGEEVAKLLSLSPSELLRKFQGELESQQRAIGATRGGGMPAEARAALVKEIQERQALWNQPAV
ncbi:MAG TPA: tape measure protein, partial [Thermoleophilia bacterium]|nr:tape measure protein [Thermoleophilia bacterium]